MFFGKTGAGVTPSHSHSHGHSCDGHTHGHGHSHGTAHDSCSDKIQLIKFWKYHWGLWIPIGLLSIIINPLIALYNWARSKYTEYWVPFLFTFGEYAFGGRLNAGKVARATKIIRIIATAVSVLAILSVILITGFSAFQTSGAEIPLSPEQGISFTVLAGWVTMVSMAVNMMAVFVGSSANHNKIQPYLDKRVHLQELSNRRTGKKDPVPHGQYDTAAMKTMNKVRYAHDVNGLAGTAMSFIVCLSFGMDMIGYPLGISNPILFALFCARTVSAILSVLIAPITGQYRLKVHKDEVANKMADYVFAGNNPSIMRAINSVLGDVPQSNERKCLYFSCYRACERFLEKNPDASLDPKKIRRALDPYLENNKINMQHIKHRSATMQLPQMDAFLFIENEVEAYLKGRENDPLVQTIEGRPIAAGSKEELLCRAMRNEGKNDFSGFVEKGILSKDPVTYQWKVQKNCSAPYVTTTLHGQPSFEVALMAGSMMQKSIKR